MFRPGSTAILALLLGLICGYAVGRPAEGPAKPITPVTAADHLQHALGEDDRIERTAKLAALFPSISPDELDAVLAVYREAPLNGGDIEFVPLVAWWAGFDAEAMYRWTHLDRRTRYGRVVEASFREWGKSDPERALAELPAVRGEIRHRLSTIALLVGSDESGRQPAEIAALLRELPEGPDRRAAIRALARRHLASSDAQSTAGWVDLVSADSAELSQDVALGAAWALADRSPELAAQMLSSRLTPDADLPEDIPLEIAEAWIARDPDAAMTWLASLPAGPARDRIVKSSYITWQARNRPVAMSWMASRLASTGDGIGPALEPAMDVYARLLSRDDPEGALALAQRLSDDPVRERALVAILAYWWSRDRNAAEAWMDAAEVTTEQRQGVERAAARRESLRRTVSGGSSARAGEENEQKAAEPAGGGP